jgi:DNA (cytosine-5)-methyltransferase 1
MLTFGSLFAGIGGFDLGFERAGFQCKWQVEIDDYATRILERHWPDVHRERDIRQCGRHNLERVDCIIGGFPCQDISYAGAGAGLNGARSGLFFEAARLVRELRPRAVVLENVAGLLTRGLDRVLGTLASFGYCCEWHCIPAAAVGAPHIRDRVFILAYRNGQSALPKYAEMAKLPRGDVADTKRERQQRQRQSLNSSDSASNQKGKAVDAFDGCFKHFWAVEPAMGELVDGVSGGLVRFAGRVATGIPNRVHKLRCLGNAIVPQVAEVVARMALDRLTGGKDV